MARKLRNDRRAHSVRELGRLFKDGAVATLTVAAPDGVLHSRPVRASRIQPDGHLWALELTVPAAVDGRLQRVTIAHLSPKNVRFVSISGVAAAVRDAVTLRAWESRFRAWFPERKSRRRLALLRVRVEQVDYWDRQARSMIALGGSRAAVPAYAAPRSADRATGAGAQG